MVNSSFCERARLCKRARLAFFSARPRLFEFLDCETKMETPKRLCRKIEIARRTEGVPLKNETARPVKFD